MKKNWTDNLPGDVRMRLYECRSRRGDIPTLVDVKWAYMKEAGKDREGYTKEDALVSILDLLDSNGQWVLADLSRDEYDALKRE